MSFLLRAVLAAALLAVAPTILGQTVAPVCAESGEARTLAIADAIRQSIQDQPQLIIAAEQWVESKADRLASTAAFLPSVQVGLTNERYVPSNSSAPVVVVGNNVLGGPQTKSSFGSLSLSWNLMNSGRDWAAHRSARAGVRAASAGYDNQLQDTLTNLLQAYADLYETEVSAENQTRSIDGLKAIEARAVERFQSGHGTTVAIGQARSAVFEARQARGQACRSLVDKSAALAQTVGLHLSLDQRVATQSWVPAPEVVDEAAPAIEIVESAPAVISSRESVTAAEARLQQVHRSFGPSVSLSIQRGYLGQDTDSFARANGHLAPYDYRIGLSIQQPLFPLVAEVAQVQHAAAELRIARARYEQARLDTERNLRSALSTQRQTESSYAAARSELADAERILDLIESQYRAGRTDLDSVEHARLDRDKVQTAVQTLKSQNALALWALTRVTRPEQYSAMVLQQLHVELDDPLRLTEASRN
jgi:outer membrane protein TolC